MRTSPSSAAGAPSSSNGSTGTGPEPGRLLRLPQEDCCQALSCPSTRKYQADGGPGLRHIIGLLKGSDTPDADIATFLRANIVFWLLGATDGHAKDFSIFNAPGGRFRLTPVYDVLTAQPSLDDGQINHKAFRLAMSVGRNRHYAVDDILPRHFVQTAELAGVGTSVARDICADLAELAAPQVARVLQSLPPNFPDALARSIADAITERSNRLLQAA